MKPLRPGLLPVIMLVVVIIWALFAVSMLTGTLLATHTIQERLVQINSTYPEINTDLIELPLADETGRIAEEIDRVVKPLGPQFTTVVDAVGAIDANVKAIAEGSGSI